MSSGAVVVESPAGGVAQPIRLQLTGGGAGAPLALRTASAEAAGEDSGRHRYLLIKATAVDGSQRLAVVGRENERLAVLYSGPVGLAGRDGEYAVAVEVTPQGLLRYQRVPGLARCDGEDRLFVERYAASGWHPAPELTVPGPDLSEQANQEGPKPVTATTQEPRGSTGGPPLGVYRFVAASAQVGVQRGDLLAPPHELEDDKPATAWRVPADARGAFVTARADGSGHAVHGLRITPAPARQGALPRQLALVFGRERTQRLVVNLSPGREGAPLWVPLPAPVTSSCVSLVITQPAAGAAVTALGKVAVYSELDADASDAGLRRLAERTAGADFTSGETALRTLRALIERERSRPATAQATGPMAALLQGVAAALPSAQGAGRRRLHAVLEAVAAIRAGTPELAPALARAIALADQGERAPLWTALSQLGPGGEAALRQLAGDAKLDTPGRAEALKRLGDLASPGTLPALLAMTGAETPTEQVLQRGVVAGLSAALHCPREPAPASDPGLGMALRALSEVPAAGNSAARLTGAALLVQGMTQAQGGCALSARTQLSAALVSLFSAQSLDAVADPQQNQALFVLRYRILNGLARLNAPTAESADLLRRVLASDHEPVLRQAAVSAALLPPASPEAIDPEAIKKIAAQALADGDPGVRLAALTALPSLSVLGAGRAAPGLQGLIEQALRGDRWPMVRRAAVESRAALCPAAAPAAGSPRCESLRQAVGDRDEQVQRLALSGLARCEGAGALDVYTARLKNAEAAPALRSQSCALLIRHGFAATAPALIQKQAHETIATALLDLLADPTADERSASTIINCARAVGDLGDARDLPVLTQISATAASEVPAPIRQAAVESIAKLCARTPALPPAARKDLSAALQSAAKDPDARLQAAAQKAAARCGL